MQMKYLSYIRDELFADKIIRISKDDIGDFHKQLHQVLVDVRKAGVLAQEYFSKYLKKVSGDAETLMKIRFIKAILGFSAEKNSFDENILKNINRSIEFLAKYLSGLILTTPDGRVVLRVLEELSLKNVRYRRGDIIVLGLEDAFMYVFLGIAKPVESIISELTT